MCKTKKRRSITLLSQGNDGSDSEEQPDGSESLDDGDNELEPAGENIDPLGEQ